MKKQLLVLVAFLILAPALYFGLGSTLLKAQGAPLTWVVTPPNPTVTPTKTPTPTKAPTITPTKAPTVTPTKTPTPTVRQDVIYLDKAMFPSTLVKKEYSATLTATDTKPKTVVSLTIDPKTLPPGIIVKGCTEPARLFYSKVTCTIGGTAKTAGNYMVKVTVKNNYGTTLTKLLPLIVIK